MEGESSISRPIIRSILSTPPPKISKSHHHHHHPSFKQIKQSYHHNVIKQSTGSSGSAPSFPSSSLYLTCESAIMIASLAKPNTCRLISRFVPPGNDGAFGRSCSNSTGGTTTHCTIEFDCDITCLKLVSEPKPGEKPSSSHRKRKRTSSADPATQQKIQKKNSVVPVLIVITRDGTMWRSTILSSKNSKSICWSTGTIKATRIQKEQFKKENGEFRMMPCQIHQPNSHHIFSPFFGINQLASPSSSFSSGEEENGKGGLYFIASGKNTLSLPKLLHIPPITPESKNTEVVVECWEIGQGLEDTKSRITSILFLMNTNDDTTITTAKNENDVRDLKGKDILLQKLWEAYHDKKSTDRTEKQNYNAVREYDKCCQGCILFGLEDGALHCSFLLLHAGKEGERRNVVTASIPIFSLRKRGMVNRNGKNQSIISLLHISSSSSSIQHEPHREENGSGDAIICVGSLGDVAILFHHEQRYTCASSLPLFRYATSSSSFASPSATGGYVWTSATSLNAHQQQQQHDHDEKNATTATVNNTNRGIRRGYENYEWPFLVTRHDGSTVLCVITAISACFSSATGSNNSSNDNNILWTNEDVDDLPPQQQQQYRNDGSMDLTLSTIQLSIRKEMKFLSNICGHSMLEKGGERDSNMMNCLLVFTTFGGCTILMRMESSSMWDEVLSSSICSESKNCGAGDGGILKSSYLHKKRAKKERLRHDDDDISETKEKKKKKMENINTKNDDVITKKIQASIRRLSYMNGEQQAPTKKGDAELDSDVFFSRGKRKTGAVGQASQATTSLAYERNIMETARDKSNQEEPINLAMHEMRNTTRCISSLMHIQKRKQYNRTTETRTNVTRAENGSSLFPRIDSSLKQSFDRNSLVINAKINHVCVSAGLVADKKKNQQQEQCHWNCSIHALQSIQPSICSFSSLSSLSSTTKINKLIPIALDEMKVYCHCSRLCRCNSLSNVPVMYGGSAVNASQNVSYASVVQSSHENDRCNKNDGGGLQLTMQLWDKYPVSAYGSFSNIFSNDVDGALSSWVSSEEPFVQPNFYQSKQYFDWSKAGKNHVGLGDSSASIFQYGGSAKRARSERYLHSNCCHGFNDTEKRNNTYCPGDDHIGSVVPVPLRRSSESGADIGESPVIWDILDGIIETKKSKEKQTITSAHVSSGGGNVESVAQYLVRVQPRCFHRTSDSVGVNIPFERTNHQDSRETVLPVERERAIIEAYATADKYGLLDKQRVKPLYSCCSSSFPIAPSSSIEKYLFHHDGGERYFSSGHLVGFRSVGVVIGKDSSSSTSDSDTNVKELGFAIGANAPLGELSTYIPLIRSSICRRIIEIHRGNDYREFSMSEMEATQVLQLYQKSLSNNRTMKMVRYLLRAAEKFDLDESKKVSPQEQKSSSRRDFTLSLYKRLRNLNILIS